MLGVKVMSLEYSHEGRSYRPLFPLCRGLRIEHNFLVILKKNETEEEKKNETEEEKKNETEEEKKNGIGAQNYWLV